MSAIQLFDTEGISIRRLLATLAIGICIAACFRYFPLMDLAAAQGVVRVAASQSVQDGSGVASANTVRAVVRSFETAAISSELNARIIHLPQREGDKVKKGDLVVEFDCRRIVAERDAVAAQMRAHQRAYQNQLNLLKYKAAGTLAVEQARAELEKSEAELRGLEAKNTTCRILAPFDARVAEKTAQVHEIAQPNQPLIKLVNEQRLELVLMVPSNWLSGLHAQAELKVRMDESGTTHRARILQATGVIDPVSQSARIIAELVDPPLFIVPGMSGTVFFERVEQKP